ncbi:lipase family protein [Actinokineospora alba]|uniref:lipase family protein n=1 Tax=Actinokineospora alba TaxID=504798 RepID=UPI001E507AEC|nr:lipase family protein [Actinokineospora alba]
MALRPTRRWGALALAFGALVTGGVLVAPATQAQQDPPSFYDTPASLPPNNGDIVRAEAMTFYLDPLKVTRIEADVHRVMYRSSDRDGTPIAVTGTVITPRTPWLGAGERPIIGYAPGTQGLGDHCAPTRQAAMGTEYEGLFLAGLVLRGYGIAMTDYQGLGTAGVHTYMNRVVQGTAVLDSIRAAQRLPEAGLPDDGPVAISGYSQGGGASASAAELHPAYAPELDVKGAVAGAVPADLVKVGVNIDGGLYVAFLGYALAGLAAGYDIDLSPLLNDRGKQVLSEVEQYCTIEAVARFALTRSADLTVDGRPFTDHLSERPDLQRIADEQTLGTLKPSVPVLVNHSWLDDVIPFKVGKKLSTDWCGLGANVRFSANLGPTHVGGAVAAQPKIYLWLESRFAGVPALSNCRNVPLP